jgi:hypothetical protein
MLDLSVNLWYVFVKNERGPFKMEGLEQSTAFISHRGCNLLHYPTRKIPAQTIRRANTEKLLIRKTVASS